MRARLLLLSVVLLARPAQAVEVYAPFVAAEPPGSHSVCFPGLPQGYALPQVDFAPPLVTLGSVR